MKEKLNREFEESKRWKDDDKFMSDKIFLVVIATMVVRNIWVSTGSLREGYVIIEENRVNL